MPTYQYACRNCGHTFETHQSIKAEPLRDCPKCQNHALEKIISGGSGYFVKDSGVLPDAKPKPKDAPLKEKKKDHHHHDHGHGHGHHHHCHHH